MGRRRHPHGPLEAGIASDKVAETVEFVPALPKRPTGKILKKELRGERPAPGKP